MHRFLNCLGGYVRHVNSYSLGTSTVLLAHVIANVNVVLNQATAKFVVAEHSRLVVAFGGLSPKDAAVSPGGVSRHNGRRSVSAARVRGCRFVSVSPFRDDTALRGAGRMDRAAVRHRRRADARLAQMLDTDRLPTTGSWTVTRAASRGSPVMFSARSTTT